MSAPLTITGFTYLRSLGQFSLGDSYVYREEANQRDVHVMIARQQQSVDAFIAAFEAAVGGIQPDLILYAGLTDRDRPYLITDFLDPQEKGQVDAVAPDPAATTPAEDAPVDDETVIAFRGELDDATRLSAPKRAPSVGGVPADDATILKPRTLPSAQVVEDPVHAPALILDESQRRYSPRSAPPQTATSRSATPSWFLRGGDSVRAPQASVRQREQRRARGILLAVGASIVFSSLVAVATVVWLMTR